MRYNRRSLTNEELQEVYETMLEDMAHGECAVFDDFRASGPTRVVFCGSELGVIDGTAYDDYIAKQLRLYGPIGMKRPTGLFRDHKQALRALKAEMKKQCYWPNIYHINDHGNVALLDGQGREVAGWV